MTAQVGETLLINGEEHEMFTEPLRFLFALMKRQPPFIAISTACGGAMSAQYGQTVLLNFRGMSFPHVNCATLVKAC